jgi:hypothetical protein
MNTWLKPLLCSKSFESKEKDQNFTNKEMVVLDRSMLYLASSSQISSKRLDHVKCWEIKLFFFPMCVGIWGIGRELIIN